MESVLKIINLKYKDILKDITFSLKEKSFNILIGSNGSGKTTLVNAVRGLLNYDGEILIFDNDIKQKKSFDVYKKVGFFISDNLYLEDIVFNELLELLINLNYSEEKAKKKIFDITKKLDIVHTLYKNEKELLHFEKIMLLFTFSIIHEPKLLIIDNELEELDTRYTNLVLDYIKKQKDLTVLFITTRSEYFCYADKILILKDGKITSECDFKDILENEKKLIKSGSTLPFSIDLSSKLIAYELIDKVEPDIEKMVDEIWK